MNFMFVLIIFAINFSLVLPSIFNLLNTSVKVAELITTEHSIKQPSKS